MFAAANPPSATPHIVRLVHPIAGVIAFVTILAFWTATVSAELLGSQTTIAAVKQAIAWALFILVPALAVTGLTGFRLAAGAASPLLARKKRRMPVIAGNGIAILVPAAITLAILSARGEFGTPFVIVQTIELLAGAVNLAKCGLQTASHDLRGLRRRHLGP